LTDARSKRVMNSIKMTTNVILNKTHINPILLYTALWQHCSEDKSWKDVSTIMLKRSVRDWLLCLVLLLV